MIRVLIVDDHAVVRAGLERLLSQVDDFSVIGSAADGEEAVRVALEQRPDVVLMDLSMPNMGGIAATEAIVAAAPQVRVVVLTSYSDRDRILNALDAGAVGYLLKDADPPELIAGIRTAAGGESPLHPKAATAVLRARAERRPVHELSDREREVLELVATGLSNQKIAVRLGISEKTVKAHLTSVFRQLGVDDRTQAAVWARENGLVPSRD
ncbi:MAG TPA: response regulator transcription factor [Solirubrobacteraceae bacterium]|nr:response regulator transcription factor [Solirubrobacteraceae bacterium]